MARLINIDLIVPGLFDLAVDELDPSFLRHELPALNQLLRFGHPRRNQSFDLESLIIRGMGWSGLQTLPLAQAYAKQGGGNSDKRLLFKAIHLRADMHNAVATPLEDNLRNNDDIAIIINGLKDFFNKDCDIHEVQQGLWMMHLKQVTPAQHYPHYLSVIGRKIDPYIEQSKQALPWYKLMNEMQMFMHQHQINQDRLQSGLVPVNSLWFWGAGNSSHITKKNINWYCDDELLANFARACGIPCATLEQIQTDYFNSDSIIIDLGLLEALKTSNESSLRTILSNMESSLFQPLMTMAMTRQCILRLSSGSQIDLKMNAWSALMRWKKPKFLTDYINHQ